LPACAVPSEVSGALGMDRFSGPVPPGHSTGSPGRLIEVMGLPSSAGLEGLIECFSGCPAATRQQSGLPAPGSTPGPRRSGASLFELSGGRLGGAVALAGATGKRGRSGSSLGLQRYEPDNRCPARHEPAPDTSRLELDRATVKGANPLEGPPHNGGCMNRTPIFRGAEQAGCGAGTDEALGHEALD